MNRESVEAAIPHRAPMLLIDEIVECEQQRIQCRKTFRDDEFFVQGHYPGFPLVPGVILCECAMQAGGILLARLASEQKGVPVATRMNKVRFRNMVPPLETPFRSMSSSANNLPTLSFSRPPSDAKARLPSDLSSHARWRSLENLRQLDSLHRLKDR